MDPSRAMSKFGYIRVSPNVPETDQQLANIKLDHIFIDRVTGRDSSRPELEHLLSLLQRGDIVYVHSMDRLALNVQHLLELIEQFNVAKVTLIFVLEKLVFTPDTDSSPLANLPRQLLQAVAQFERSLIKESRKEGIAKAKARGLYKGRSPINKDRVKEALTLCENGTSVVKAAKSVGISKSTLYNYIAKHKAS